MATRPFSRSANTRSSPASTVRCFTSGSTRARFPRFTRSGRKIWAGMPDDAILIVCGGLLQVPAVEIAHGLGLTVVMTDANRRAAAMALADEPVTLDIYDADGHCRLVDDLARRYRLLGVFAEGADVEV